MLLLTASGSGLAVLYLSASKEDTLAKTFVEAMLLALFSGGLYGTLFLEFACHAAGACGVLLRIMVLLLAFLSESWSAARVGSSNGKARTT